jgi:GST-like protein
MLEEVGLPYMVHKVDIMASEQFRPEFLAISPNNKIPAIVDHDGPDGKPQTVFETGAILIYLAEKTGLLLPAEPGSRSRVLQWLMFQASGLGPAFGQLGHFQSFAKEKIPYAIDHFHAEATRLHGVLEKQLANHAYIAGDEYTIADVATFPWFNEGVRGILGFDWSPFPCVQRWHAEIALRPAVQRGLAVSS